MTNHADLTGTSINLGNQTNDTIGFGTLTFTSAGSVSIFENSSTRLSGSSSANSLVLDSAGALENDDAASLQVTGLADIRGTAITLGDELGDSFHFGTLRLATAGAALISEDSATVLQGSSSAGSLALTSTSSLTNQSGSSLVVTGLAALAASSIDLGNQTGDSLNFGSVRFNATGSVRIVEDSALVIEQDNSADSLTLTSTASVTNMADASLVTTNHGSFNGTSIDLGNQTNDLFRVGSLAFVSTGTVSISEDQRTILSGTSSADSLVLTSAAALSNQVSASLTVSNHAHLTGTSIDLGNQTSDAIYFGSLQFTSSGSVQITENQRTVLSNTSTAVSLVLSSSAALSNAASASLSVTNHADLRGTSINLGNQTGDAVYFGSLQFTSGGAVSISENQRTILSNSSSANSLVLSSAAGISNQPAAQLTVTNNANLSATSIQLGNQTNDTIHFGSLTLTSTGAVVIREDSSSLVTGTNTAGTLDLLSHAGGITLQGTTTVQSTTLITAQGTAADLSITGQLISNPGPITLSAIRDVTMSNTARVTSVSGTVRILADADVAGGVTAGKLTMTDGAIIQAGSGSVDVETGGTVTLASIQTTGLLEIESRLGAIVDGGDPDPDLVAGQLRLIAEQGIGGPAGQRLETATAGSSMTLAAITDSGDLRLTHTGNLLIGGVNATSGVTIADTVNGDPQNLLAISVLGNLVIDANVTNESLGNIQLFTSNDLTLNASRTIRTLGKIELRVDHVDAGPDPDPGTGATLTIHGALDTPELEALGGPDGDLLSFNQSFLRQATITGGAGDDTIRLNGLTGDGTTRLTIDGGAGTADRIEFHTQDSLLGSGQATITAEIVSVERRVQATGNLTFNNDDLLLNTSSGHLDAGSGRLTVRPQTANRPLVLGTTSVTGNSELELSIAQIQRFRAGTLELGSATTGNIILRNSVASPGADPTTQTFAWPVLHLITGAGIDDAHLAAQDIVVPQLAIESVTGLPLGGQPLQIAVQTLAIRNHNPSGSSGVINIENLDPTFAGTTGAELVIDVVDGIRGITNRGTTGNLLRIRNHGGLVVREDVLDLTGTPVSGNRGSLVLASNESTGGGVTDDHLDIRMGAEIRSANGPVELSAGDRLTLSSDALIMGADVTLRVDTGSGGELGADGDQVGATVILAGGIFVCPDGTPTATLLTSGLGDSLVVTPNRTISVERTGEEPKTGAALRILAGNAAVPLGAPNRLVLDLKDVTQPQAQTPHLSPPAPTLAGTHGTGLWTFGNRASIEYVGIHQVQQKTLDSRIIDNGEPGFSMAQGSFSAATGAQHYLGDVHTRVRGTGLHVAQWTFTDLVPNARYRVSTTWAGSATNASNATYVLMGGQAVESVAVDQRRSAAEHPAAFNELGYFWVELSSAYDLGAGQTSLTVQLSDAANGTVFADAVRIERIVVQPEVGLFAATTELYDAADPTHAQGRFNFPLTGFQTPSPQQVFTILNSGAGDLQLGDVRVPAGFRLDYGPLSRLLTTGQTTTFAVSLLTSTPGQFEGPVTVVTNDVNERLFTFRVAGEVTGTVQRQIVDNAATPNRVPENRALPVVGYFTVPAATTSAGADQLTANSFGILSPGNFAYASSQATYYGDDASGGDVHYVGAHIEGSGLTGVDSIIDVAQWQFIGLPAGMYRVSTTWGINAQLAKDAPFSIFDGMGAAHSDYRNSAGQPSHPVSALETVKLDQSRAPSSSATSFSDVGYTWADLGYYTISSGRLTVQLSNLASGMVAADAIRIEPFTGPEIRVHQAGVEKELEDGLAAVAFGELEPNAQVTRSFVISNRGNQPLVLSSLSLPSGFSSTFVPITVAAGASTTLDIRFSSSLAGSFSGTARLSSNDVDEGIFEFNVSGMVAAQRQIIDDGDPTFALLTNNFAYYSQAGSQSLGFFQNDAYYAAASNGASSASWTFTNLPPGFYQVSTTWAPHANRATDAPFTINGNGAGNLPQTVRLNQRLSPSVAASSLTDAGVPWSILSGGYQLGAGGNTLTVTLASTPTGFIMADAVRIERVFLPEVAATENGRELQDGQSVIDFGALMRNSPNPSRLISVRNEGAVALNLGALTLPAGYSADYVPGQSLAPNATLDIRVTLSTAVEGVFGGLFSLASNDADEASFDIVLTADVGSRVIIDNDSPGFTMDSGTFLLSSGADGSAFYGGNARYQLQGNGSQQVSWRVDHLVAGETYEVAATWLPLSNRATNAPFTIHSGSTTVTPAGGVNQRVAPDSFLVRNSWWESLGTITIPANQSSLTVSLTNLADGTVIADAIHVRRADPPSPAEIEVVVLPSNTLIRDGLSTLDFGSTFVGGANLSQTVQIRNVGTAPLELIGEITVPSGFQVSGYVPQTLAVGGSLNLTLTLPATTLGSFGGTVKFLNNDSDENDFDFQIQGRVNSAVILDNANPFTSSFAGAWTYWSGSSGAGFYGSNVHFTAGGTGTATASWRLDGVVPGERYQVAATWLAHSNRATNAPYRLSSGTTSWTVSGGVNQQLAPNDFTSDGAAWEVLGVLQVPAGATNLSVELTNAANGFVIADAIRIERYNGPEITLRQDSTFMVSNQSRVDFPDTITGGQAATRSFTVTNDGNQPLVLSALQMPSGFTSNFIAGQTVAVGGSYAFTLQLPATIAGQFTGTVSLTSNDLDESPFRWTVAGNVRDALIIDNEDSGFAAPNFLYLGGSGATTFFGGDVRYQEAGTGTRQATWQFERLTAGETYTVAATWGSHTNRATNAPFRLQSGATVVNASVNQRIAPSGLTVDGATWQNLGQLTIPSGQNSLTVSLSDAANGFVIADAVRLVRTSSIGAAEVQVTLVETGQDLLDGTGVIDFGRVFAGSPTVARTLRIRNVGQQTLTLGSTLHLPSGFTTQGYAATSLAPASQLDVTVRMSTATAGSFSGTLSFSSNDSDESPFDVRLQGSVSAVRIIDDGEAGFSIVSGSFTTYSRAGSQSLYGFYRDDTRYAAAGTGRSVAQWVFTGLTAGVYQVATTWGASSNRATNSPFTVRGNATGDLQVSTLVNQRQTPSTAPGAFQDSAGVWWAVLSSAYVLNAGGNQITVQLSDKANNFVIADAVRLIEVLPLHAAEGFAPHDIAANTELVASAGFGMPLEPTALPRDTFVDRSTFISSSSLPTESISTLTQTGQLQRSQLHALAELAVNQWLTQPLTAAQRASLNAVRFDIADLPGELLGVATPELVTLDRDAAGRYWQWDEASSSSATWISDLAWQPVHLQSGISSVVSHAADHAGHAGHAGYDLLTVLRHELGHVIGLPDLDPQQFPDSLMSGTLTAGIRKSLPHDASRTDASRTDASGMDAFLNTSFLTTSHLLNSSTSGLATSRPWRLSQALASEQSAETAFALQTLPTVTWRSPQRFWQVFSPLLASSEVDEQQLLTSPWLASSILTESPSLSRSARWSTDSTAPIASAFDDWDATEEESDLLAPEQSGADLQQQLDDFFANWDD